MSLRSCALLICILPGLCFAQNSSYLCTIDSIDIYPASDLDEEETEAVSRFVNSEFILNAATGEFSGVDFFRGILMESPEIRNFSSRGVVGIMWKGPSYRESIHLQIAIFPNREIYPFRIELGDDFAYSGRCIGIPENE